MTQCNSCGHKNESYEDYCDICGEPMRIYGVFLGDEITRQDFEDSGETGSAWFDDGVSVDFFDSGDCFDI